LIDQELEQSMDLALDACNLGHAARNTSGIKVRQPLQAAIIVAEKTNLDHLASMKDLLKGELNVKRVDLIDDRARIVRYQVTLRPQLGAKYGRLFPAIRSIVDSMDHFTMAQTLQSGSSFNVNVQGQNVTLVKDDVEIATKAKPGFEIAEGENLLVAIDTNLTEDLKDEGLARDIVRRIQNQRKEAGFDIADEIEIYYETGPRLERVFTKHGAEIRSETLARILSPTKIPDQSNTADYELDGERLRIGIVRLMKASV
jgi:isoleucyl-tRNA synthetase